MRELIKQFLDSTGWLYTKIYENPLFFIDYWSLNHIWAGCIISLILITSKVKNKLLLFLLILCGWELFEILFLKISFNIFHIETLKDQFTDIVIGLLSGYLTLIITKNKGIFKRFKFINFESVTAVFSAISIAFLWVGFYHYHYSRAEFNSPGINYWAFILWFFGYLTMFRYYVFLEKKIIKLIPRIIIYWLSYFAVLFIIEYIGRYVIEIKEVSNPANTPLIFGLVYGSPTLHFFYSIAPIISISVFLPIRKLMSQAAKIESHPVFKRKILVFLNNIY